MNISTRIIVTTLALGAAVLASAGNLPDIRVQYRTGELTSTAGATGVYRRLSAAAQQSCAQLNGAGLNRQRVYRNCVNKLLASAVRDVQSLKLAAVHEAHTGERIEVAQAAIRLADESAANGRYAR